MRQVAGRSWRREHLLAPAVGRAMLDRAVLVAVAVAIAAGCAAAPDRAPRQALAPAPKPAEPPRVPALITSHASGSQVAASAA